ncbi:L,D-transpeptidase family protein [Nocardioides aequoreus]|uniref:L,D-transpeptidase family protein n=1 Tax=Nocardioides aequoreus TaxID=397278 RepID=UPI001FDF5E17|nr:L,D-transpeptidase family protein [Nocardioides aequoreus]
MTRARPVLVAVVLALTMALATTLLAGPAEAARSTVADSQRVLNSLRCQAGSADGQRDTKLRAAVTRFQSRHALRQTGRLDRPTRMRLHRSAERLLRCDVRPLPERSGKGRRIVVSQSQHWLWLVRANGRVVEQGPMIDDERELRPGRYTTGSYCGRAARVVRNRDLSGRLWLDHFVRFAPCGFGFHGIPRRTKDGEPIHAEWLLGTDLDRSHGCLRVSRAMERSVWRFTGHGRTVIRVLG